MKQFTIAICTAGILLLSCNDSNKTNDKTTSKDSTASNGDTAKMNHEAMMPMDSAAMMKCWMDYMTPGDVHKMLAKANGTWDEDITMWMDPGKPPTTSKSTAVNT